MGSKQIAGGMYKKTEANQMVINYTSVKSIDDSIKNFKKAGGKIFMEKMEVPNVGWTATGFDPSGNPKASGRICLLLQKNSTRRKSDTSIDLNRV